MLRDFQETPNERNQSRKCALPISKRSIRPADGPVLCNLRTPTLFGQWAVVREWGRIGQAGAVRENWLESKSESSATGTKLRRQKERRGYRAL
jgi:WGR domain-containing protein